MRMQIRRMLMPFRFHGFGVLAFIALCCLPARGQGTFTAKTCNISDVQAVVSGPAHVAVNGDTIIIPAGTCTWSGGIVINGIGVDITGQGTPNIGTGTYGAGAPTTIITMNSSSPLFEFTGLAFGQTAKVELMQLTAGASALHQAITFAGTCTVSGCANIRVDNILWTSNTWETPNQGFGYIATDGVFGVVDHNSSTEAGAGSPPLTQVNFSAWQGVGDHGDNSFASADTFGTNQAFYIENNYLNAVRATENDAAPPGGGLGGQRVVCRFNYIDNQSGTGVCSAHGTSWIGRQRGQRQVEAYYNNDNNPSSINAINGLNSGTGIYIGNEIVTSPGLNSFLTVDVPRAWQSSPTPQFFGYCDGVTAWDMNNTVAFTGTITTGGLYSITDTTRNWTTNQWAGNAITSGFPYSIADITTGTGEEIAGNTSATYSYLASYIPGGQFMNAGDTYSIGQSAMCMDQTGTGPTLLVQDSGGRPVLASTGTPGPVNPSSVRDPVYEAAETANGHMPGFGPVHTLSNKLLSDRDFYQEVSQSSQSSPTAPFNGTTGTGYGTLANRPTTCTKGVGYWATDQGNWNQSGGSNPASYSGQGELFVCSATNTWVEKYQPYIYPHPLITGSVGGTGTPPSPPSGQPQAQGR